VLAGRTMIEYGRGMPWHRLSDEQAAPEVRGSEGGGLS
jgi:hypothetical protein